jgi:hypothetical protein
VRHRIDRVPFLGQDDGPLPLPQIGQQHFLQSEGLSTERDLIRSKTWVGFRTRAARNTPANVTATCACMAGTGAAAGTGAPTTSARRIADRPVKESGVPRWVFVPTGSSIFNGQEPCRGPRYPASSLNVWLASTGHSIQVALCAEAFCAYTRDQIRQNQVNRNVLRSGMATEQLDLRTDDAVRGQMGDELASELMGMASLGTAVDSVRAAWEQVGVMGRIGISPGIQGQRVSHARQ